MSSTSETSSSDVETSTQVSPKRGATLASKRKAAFEPPQGAVLMDGPGGGSTIETGEFDWNTVKDDEDIELWLIRVPNSVCRCFNSFPFFPPFLPDWPPATVSPCINFKGPRPLREAP